MLTKEFGYRFLVRLEITIAIVIDYLAITVKQKGSPRKDTSATQRNVNYAAARNLQNLRFLSIRIPFLVNVVWVSELLETCRPK